MDSKLIETLDEMKSGFDHRIDDRFAELEARIDAAGKGRGGRAKASHDGPREYDARALLSKSESFADAVKGDTGSLAFDEPAAAGPERLGAMLHAMARKDTSGLSEVEAKGLAGTSDPEGAITIPTAIASTVIDLARIKSTALAAGAATMPMTERFTVIPKALTGADGSSLWRAERGTVQEVSQTIGSITLNAHSIAALTKVSWELLEDASPDVWQFIVNDLTSAIGTEIDRAIYLGSGAGNEPLGIVNWSGVQEVASVGTPTDYGGVLDAVEKIETANHEARTWIRSPREARTYRGLVTGISGDNTPLAKPEGVPPVIQSNQFTVDSGESQMLVGDFRHAVLGVRPALSVRVLRLDELFAETGEVGVICALRADVAVRYPESFCTLTGVTNT